MLQLKERIWFMKIWKKGPPQKKYEHMLPLEMAKYADEV